MKAGRVVAAILGGRGAPDRRADRPVERFGAVVPASRRRMRSGRSPPASPRSPPSPRSSRCSPASAGARLAPSRSPSRAARLVEHDHAAARRRLGARRRAADDRDDQRRHLDALRRARFRLAHRRRLHRAMGDALLRPVEAQGARPFLVLLGRAGDGACHHELRIRGRRLPGLVGRGPAREEQRLFAGRRRFPVAHAGLSRDRPSATRCGCARTCAARTSGSIGFTPPAAIARCCCVEYVVKSNALAKRPKWYNSITANCATAVVKIAEQRGRRCRSTGGSSSTASCPAGSTIAAR